LGSRELIFHPGKVTAGDYHFAIGTAGSTTLLLQTVLLPLLMRSGLESRVRISGGTHNPLAPPFEFVEQCFLPILRRMGAEIELRLVRHGFVPAGGGEIECVIKPLEALKPVDLRERNAEPDLQAVAVVSKVPAHIGQRGIDAMMAILAEAKGRVQAVTDSACPGVVFYAQATCPDPGICEISSAFGQIGKTAEALGSGAAKGLQRYLHSRVPIGVHLADQLLLPFALAGGGSFRTLPPDDHSTTNQGVIRQFLGEVVSLMEVARGVTEATFSR
jgi:RNA 3'-terminal phosphate cyclase (ATP)